MALATSIIGGVSALGSAIAGSVASSKANRRARDIVQGQKDANRQWYNREMNEDYTSRSDVQAILEKQRELLDARYNQSRAQAAVSGASDEAQALEKEAANKSVADASAQIAANAENYKEGVEQQYMQTDAELSQQQARDEQSRAQAAAAAGSAGIAAGLNLVGAGFAASADKNNPEKKKS